MATGSELEPLLVNDDQDRSAASGEEVDGLPVVPAVPLHEEGVLPSYEGEEVPGADHLNSVCTCCRRIGLIT